MEKKAVIEEGVVVEFEQKGLLKWIERVGNKLPHPVILFVYLCGIFMVLSAVLAAADVSVFNPATKETDAVKSLLSQEGIHWILMNMLTNFTSFPPLGLVLGMTLGIGLAEKVGLIQAVLRAFVTKIPKAYISLAVVFMGIMGNLASDASVAVIPPMGAMIFLALGRHPLAGFAAALGGWGAGFTANLFIAGTDALLSGISTLAAQTIDPSITVTPVDNWFFMVASVFILSFLGAWITDRMIEPRLGTYKGDKTIQMEPFNAAEKRALKMTSIAALLFTAVIAALVIPPDGFLRDPETGGILTSPFLKGIIPIILLFFIITSVVYGKITGIIKSSSDIPHLMADALKMMAGFIVLVFAASQFVAFFEWTNVGIVLAVSGSSFLESIHLTGFPLILLFVLFVTMMNLFIASGSAMWAILAPVFIPMFILLDYHPAFVQAAFRIADSSTNMVTPMNPYIPLVLAYYQQYKKDAGLGTVFSTMLPYAVLFLLIWMVQMAVWYFFDLPFGPGIHAK